MVLQKRFVYQILVFLITLYFFKVFSINLKLATLSTFYITLIHSLRMFLNDVEFCDDIESPTTVNHNTFIRS